MSHYVISWCHDGLEAVVPITELEKQQTWDVLTGSSGSGKLNHILNMLLLRARYNPQRHYEVYSIQTTDDITEKDLISMFNEGPQQAADLIRERGTQLYSDRVKTSTIRII